MGCIKIAFFDIDGTLIATDKETMSEKTVETLLRLKENGVKLCIATGRPPYAIPSFSNITFDAYLSFNGSLCYTKEEVIYKHPIAPTDVKTILHNAQNIQRFVIIASKTRMGTNGYDKVLEEYLAIANQHVDVIEDFAALANKDIYQIMMAGRNDEYERILQGTTNAKITAWWPRAMDIIPANGGKNIGVERILDFYHFSKEDAIAFGDGNNDIDMLQAVGFGVAMGNASDDVKHAADAVCGSVSQDGIYHYCIEHHLI